MNDEEQVIKNKTVGFLLLRIFFSQFWILQFYGKLFDQESRTTRLENLTIWSSHTTDWFLKQTLLPRWVVSPYTRALPFCEVSIGILLLIGLETRAVLVASALLLISLDAGLLLQLKHDSVATNTIYLIAIVIAILWEPCNRWTLDAFLGSEPPRPRR